MFPCQVQQPDLGTPGSGDVDDWDDKAALMVKQVQIHDDVTTVNATMMMNVTIMWRQCMRLWRWMWQWWSKRLWWWLWWQWQWYWDNKATPIGQAQGAGHNQGWWNEPQNTSHYRVWTKDWLPLCSAWEAIWEGGGWAISRRLKMRHLCEPDLSRPFYQQTEIRNQLIACENIRNKFCTISEMHFLKKQINL